MEEVRYFPEPHRYAVCTSADVPIKTFYSGVFNEVFIFFHPFIRPVGVDPENYFPQTCPHKSEMIKHAEAVSWKAFRRLSGIGSNRELDIGLRTRIGGLIKKFADPELADAIDRASDIHRLIPPTEGFLPELIINKLFQGVKSECGEWLWVGDEFCTERKLEFIDDLITGDAPDGKNLFTHDQSLLITTHWDSHFSMVCSKDRKKLERIVRSSGLEGFFCSNRTEIYWSVWNPEEGEDVF
ncbi:DUF2711 family protein [Bhargavaea ullalensis]|uniref:DUF2711 domain-containing protein n=1 Tax=Bhargavaea ullalensis TaxID=1265685 RepID=A0ABV2GBD8_9BACL